MLITLAGIGFASIHTPNWEASQTLVIRNEAATGQDSPGKFNGADEMKTVQETLMELIKSQGVLLRSLTKVGPPADARTAAVWPTSRDIDSLRKAVKLVPPNGTEFGKTEVFYLKVQDRDRSRAEALATAICDQLDTAFQQLRDAKAHSMIDELVNVVKLARDDLAQSTRQLTEIETQVGSDLAELRSLHESASGESALRRTITEIRNEMRQCNAAVNSDEQLLARLTDVQQDPCRLVVIPNQLIEAQPALRRLKEGLAEAQLRTAQLSGGMSDQHPSVQAARESEHQIYCDLRSELATARRGVEIDLRLHGDRERLLEEQLAQARRRLDRLAALRAPYANQVAETRHRTSLVERTEQRLAEARASAATAKAASLLARVDSPDTGVQPVGPGRATIGLAGVLGGLLAGWGVLFLTVPTAPNGPVSVPPANPAHTTCSLPAAWQRRTNGDRLVR
jgi:uncharacterized protein involved in exopolysaccharide biosynthesis